MSAINRTKQTLTAGFNQVLSFFLAILTSKSRGAVVGCSAMSSYRVTDTQGSCVRFRNTSAPISFFLKSFKFASHEGKQGPVIFSGGSPSALDFASRKPLMIYYIWNSIRIPNHKSQQTTPQHETKTQISPIEQTYDRTVQIYRHWRKPCFFLGNVCWNQTSFGIIIPMTFLKSLPINYCWWFQNPVIFSRGKI